MSLDAEIRSLHDKGYSRTEIGRALNIPFNKIKLMCEFMEDLTWPETNPGMTRRQAHARHTLRGIEGTLEELMMHFGVEWKTETVRRRLNNGKSLEEAFFTGRPKIRSWYRESFEAKAATTSS
jgi:hypothetical protein